MKPEVEKIIESWYNNVNYEIIHFWEQDDTWFVIIKYSPGGIHPELNYTKFDFARIFGSYMIQGEYHISVDKTVNV